MGRLRPEDKMKNRIIALALKLYLSDVINAWAYNKPRKWLG